MALAQVLDRLEADSASLMDAAASDAAAYPYLRLAALAATGWCALRFTALDCGAPPGRRLAAAGRRWLADLPARAAVESARIQAAADTAALFEAVRPEN